MADELKPGPATELHDHAAEAPKTARQIIEHLRDTGTPAARIEQLEGWLTKQPAATGEAIVQHMIDDKVTVGTIEKAGRFVNGPDFSLAAPAGKSSSDVERQLRAEVSHHKDQVRDLSNRLVQVQAECRALREQVGEQSDRQQGDRVRRSEQQAGPRVRPAVMAK